MKQNKNVEYTHNKNKTNHSTLLSWPLFSLFQHTFKTPDKQRSRWTNLKRIQIDTNKRKKIKQADTVANTDADTDDSSESLTDSDAEDNCSNVSVLSDTDNDPEEDIEDTKASLVDSDADAANSSQNPHDDTDDDDSLIVSFASSAPSIRSSRPKTTSHNTHCSTRNKPRLSSDSSTATRLHRSKKQENNNHRHKPNHCHNDDYSASSSTNYPKLFPTRQHSPSLTTTDDPKVTPRRRRWNLARIDYCVDDTLFNISDHLAIYPTPDAEPRTDQKSIGWEHFIRGHLSLSFTPIITNYYRANKLGQRFTTKK